ncbi:hypothetical protein K466DRAFT_438712, partial [Polyporus arcularius HHB13444]
VLQRHAAIISGSTALYYFMPDISWYPNDLDIYVPDCNWSDADTEYERDAPPSNKLTNRVVNTSTGLRSVRRFYTSSGRRIDVIRSPSNNAITPLRFFWSSAVMNFISPDACFCGFPRATLVRRGALK